MRCCQNKTSFSWSYRDSSKRSLENNVKSRRGKRKIHTLEIVDMCKWQRVIPRHNGSPRYRIAHGWKMSMDLLSLESLKFLMHFREPGSSLYFYFYTYSYFFFSFFPHTYTFLFLIFFSSKFFICSPLNSKIAL
jgi:hypothetical protein